MKRFEIEHIGFTVKDATAMAEWYRRVLGFGVRMAKREAPDRAAAFVTDPADACMLEFIERPDLAPVVAGCTDGLQFHIAVRSQDIAPDVAHLEANGATFVCDCAPPTPEVHVCLLRDPWGNYLQLARRQL